MATAINGKNPRGLAGQKWTGIGKTNVDQYAEGLRDSEKCRGIVIKKKKIWGDPAEPRAIEEVKINFGLFQKQL